MLSGLRRKHETAIVLKWIIIKLSKHTHAPAGKAQLNRVCWSRHAASLPGWEELSSIIGWSRERARWKPTKPGWMDWRVSMSELYKYGLRSLSLVSLHSHKEKWCRTIPMKHVQGIWLYLMVTLFLKWTWSLSSPLLTGFCTSLHYQGDQEAQWVF